MRGDLKTKRGTNNYSIPVLPSLFKEKDLPISPYALGLLLGDGSLTQKSIHFHNSRLELHEALHRELYKYNFSEPVFRNGCYESVSEVSFSQILCDLKLNKKSVEKFIPNIYIHSSINQRMSLVRGLMDTDGTIGVNSNCSFSSSNERLKDDFLQLCESLGIRYKVGLKHTTFTQNGEKHKGKLSYIAVFYSMKRHNTKVENQHMWIGSPS